MLEKFVTFKLVVPVTDNALVAFTFPVLILAAVRFPPTLKVPRTFPPIDDTVN